MAGSTSLAIAGQQLRQQLICTEETVTVLEMKSIETLKQEKVCFIGDLILLLFPISFNKKLPAILSTRQYVGVSQLITSWPSI